MDLILPDEAATQRAGASLARTLPDITRHNLLVGLSGELGSGKTTLARALLRALGVTGAVRSPTFTLVEPYETRRGVVHHLDLYRLEPGPAGLEGLGFRDLRGTSGLVLVEWPERAGEGLGPQDLRVGLELAGQGRRILLEAGTAVGRAWLESSRPLLEE
ncbi:MAG TPA: tRNA (adenosine(37)-N6)-threonylcarbamoyltransferase complex ATPase subunit type 1 TsaE [Steroidobacteraceae bacterium]|nr:tRNA (adenosine(37)-N6)-threonylcarbamoyltransferase complex ATPase subunit type 1 TsaE [Steroidobacteraceae bacterium]